MRFVYRLLAKVTASSGNAALVGGQAHGGELQWKSRNDCDWAFGGDRT